MSAANGGGQPQPVIRTPLENITHVLLMDRRWYTVQGGLKGGVGDGGEPVIRFVADAMPEAGFPGGTVTIGLQAILGTRISPLDLASTP